MAEKVLDHIQTFRLILGKFDDILSYDIYIKFIENDQSFLVDRTVSPCSNWRL